MASTFKGLGLFNSGPHRFWLGPQGEYVLPNAALDATLAGSQPIGPLELFVHVTGHLVAATESALWALRDAITAELTHPPQIGALVDHHSRMWEDMSFVRYVEGERTDRGRVVMVEYRAVFQRIAGWV